MDKLIGRKPEIELLEKAYISTDSELVAIYGRRRVGKTFLIRQVFGKQIIFELIGSVEGSTKSQLENFSKMLTQASGAAVPAATPKNWPDAFRMLEHWLETLKTTEKKVLFFDEMPWLDTKRSGFLSAFIYFWNSWVSKRDDIMNIVCGSAASWMIKNIVQAKGGLHNRITARIRLLPFTLQETQLYLESFNIDIEHYEILQLYMAVGGIPFYLKKIERGESPAQYIDRVCFTKDGFLNDEFKNLYQSLFDDAESHIKIVHALAAKGKGLTRKEIITECNFSTGGTVTKLLKELKESGFIIQYIPFGKAAKDTVYKITDEYSLFYLKYIQRSRLTGTGIWEKLSQKPSWRSWSGIAFESICLKHIHQIKNALGIAGIITEESIWRYASKNKQEKGAQIDLLIDRSDNCINMCEIKYSTDKYAITTEYKSVLNQKKQIFKTQTGTRKSVFITMITTFGISQSSAGASVVDKEVTVEKLFM